MPKAGFRAQLLTRGQGDVNAERSALGLSEYFKEAAMVPNDAANR